MPTLAIQTEQPLLVALEQLAQNRKTSLEALIKEILWQYLQQPPPPPKTYSFIGIGHSGKKNLSTQVEEILANSLQRKEGWSLP